jgi:hypothetical protein
MGIQSFLTLSISFGDSESVDQAATVVLRKAILINILKFGILVHVSRVSSVYTRSMDSCLSFDVSEILYNVL